MHTSLDVHVFFQNIWKMEEESEMSSPKQEKKQPKNN